MHHGVGLLRDRVLFELPVQRPIPSRCSCSDRELDAALRVQPLAGMRGDVLAWPSAVGLDLEPYGCWRSSCIDLERHGLAVAMRSRDRSGGLIEQIERLVGQLNRSVT